MPTVAITRFEDLVARGLRSVIAEDPHLEIVADDLEPERLRAVLSAKAPDVCVLNFGTLRSPLDVAELHKAIPRTRLVVLANRPSPTDASQMLGFGATACLSKDTQGRDVLSAIHLASRGLQLLPRTRPNAPEPELLTAREAEVLTLLRDGRANKEIAAALQMGVETVRTHARNIYRKLGVSTRRDLTG